MSSSQDLEIHPFLAVNLWLKYLEFVWSMALLR